MCFDIILFPVMPNPWEGTAAFRVDTILTAFGMIGRRQEDMRFKRA